MVGDGRIAAAGALGRAEYLNQQQSTSINGAEPAGWRVLGWFERASDLCVRVARPLPLRSPAGEVLLVIFAFRGISELTVMSAVFDNMVLGTRLA